MEMIRPLRELTTQRSAYHFLHLDHGSYDACYKCIEAGFSSVMFDGSHYPIEENVAKTKELVAVCKEKGLSLEAEVGSIGGPGLTHHHLPPGCKDFSDYYLSITKNKKSL